MAGTRRLKLEEQGIEMEVAVFGAGEPVLLLHGFPLRGEMWLPALEHLPQGFSYIVPDLRGHGQSAATDECTISDFADDLAALLELLDERRRIVVVGLSMGGYVALEFTRQYEACVRGLVLVDTRAEPDSQEAAKARLETAERVLREGTAVVANAMLEKLFAPEAPAPLRDYWKRIMLDTTPRGAAAALRAMASRPDSFPVLKSMTVPSLIVVGEKDVITPPDCALRMHEAAAQSELVILPGVGHMAPVESPRPFADALRRFLSRLPSKSS